MWPRCPRPRRSAHPVPEDAPNPLGAAEGLVRVLDRLLIPGDCASRRADLPRRVWRAAKRRVALCQQRIIGPILQSSAAQLVTGKHLTRTAVRIHYYGLAIHARTRVKNVNDSFDWPPGLVPVGSSSTCEASIASATARPKAIADVAFSEGIR